MHTNLKHLAIVIFLCASCTNIRYLGNRTIPIDHSIHSNQDIDEFIEPYKKQLSKSMHSFLAVLDTSYTKSKPNGNLNNLSADLIYQHALGINSEEFISFCILNYGGLRSSLPADSIFTKNIFELSPFENHLVILKLYPQHYDSLFRYLISRKSDPVSGLVLNTREGQVKIQGAKFDSRRPLYFVTNNYMANGGDGFGILLESEFRKDLDISMRKALMIELKKEYLENGFIKPRNQQRFIDE